MILVRNPPRGLEVDTLVATECLGPASTVPVGCSLQLEPSLSSGTGMASFMSSFGGGYSSLQVFQVLSSRFSASKEFGFPPSLASDLILLASPALSLAPVFFFTPLRAPQIPQPCFAPPSLSGVAVLGEKLRYSLPVVVFKPFQCHYRRAKELREGKSVKWNDVLFSDSLEAAKMTVGYVDKKVTCYGCRAASKKGGRASCEEEDRDSSEIGPL